MTTTGYNNAGAIDVGSLLTYRGFNSPFGGNLGGNYGVGGGMHVGNQTLAAGAHADGTAVKTAIDCNARGFAAGLDRVSDQNKETRDNFRFDQLNNQINNQEFRSLDRQRDIERSIDDNAKDSSEQNCRTLAAVAEAAKESALCCCKAELEALKTACETQKLISAEATATRALILEVESRSNADKLAECRSQLNQVQTVAALQNGHGHR